MRVELGKGQRKTRMIKTITGELATKVKVGLATSCLEWMGWMGWMGRLLPVSSLKLTDTPSCGRIDLQHGCEMGPLQSSTDKSAQLSSMMATIKNDILHSLTSKRKKS